MFCRIHQIGSPISKTESMNFCNEYLFIMISFSTALNWEKKLFLTNKLFVFYYANWEKLVEKISETNWWNHLMNSFLVTIRRPCTLPSWPQEYTGCDVRKLPKPEVTLMDQEDQDHLMISRWIGKCLLIISLQKM